MKAEMLKPAAVNPFRKVGQAQTQQSPEPSYNAATPKPSQTNAISNKNPKQTHIRSVKPAQAQEFEIDVNSVEAQKKANLKKTNILRKKLAEKNEILSKEKKVLTEVKREMSKMDAVMAKDVEVLRKQLESLSVQLSSCQTRYQQKEKEFEEAKKQYESVKEKKNKMTEHLIRILNENEKRKSEKLNRLMVKMDLKEEDDGRQEEKRVPDSTDNPGKSVESEVKQASRNRFSGFHDDY